ncbi:prepilin-type N-terminal cleavage/methylation domain-containing protein [Neobacillus niacini]|uniref:PulJ/GspJ family protein n=1 Tax=Neobacillus niacini TaxID=86668 RepID=UPI002FFDEFB4
MTHDERGITLIEVLITLTILSFVGISIWNVFFQGYNYSQTSMTKNALIQETNIITSTLKTIHQKSTEYRIVSTGSNCEMTVEPKIKGVVQPAKVLSNSKICISFEIKIGNVSHGSGPITIEPNKNDATIILKASDRNNPKNSTKVETFLFRVKGVDYQ